MKVITARMAGNGRVTIPAQVRGALGLPHGGSVVLELADGELRLRSVARAIERAQTLSRSILGQRDGFSVDDFIAERRREAARET